MRLASAFTALSLYHVPVPCFKRDKTRDLAVLLPESPVALEQGSNAAGESGQHHNIRVGADYSETMPSLT
jgi:hypothetical protein